MPDYLAIVKEKREEEAELDDRMRIDSDLLYLSRYVMRDNAEKPKPIPDIINATLNKPAVFGASVVSALGSTRQQVVVESDDKNFDTHEVEEFQDAAFASANARLRKWRQPALNPFADVQFCFRGRTARRILFREEKGILIPDITPWDGRYIRYEAEEKGLKWAAYETTRSKGKIEAEYGVTVIGREGKVLDVWDAKHNEVWIDEKHISVNKDGTPRKEEHNYGETPVVVDAVSLGYGDILLDGNMIANEGESIFFLIRGVVPQLNMLVSVLTTLNFLSIKAPQEWGSKEGQGAEPPDYDKAIKPGAVTSKDIGGGFERIDFGDATRAAQMVHAILEKAVQEGSYTDIDIGNVSQPFSAVALITIGESKDQIYLPRLAAKESLNIQTAEMFTRQVIQIGGTVELGVPGHKRDFSTSKLKGEYTTDYKYFVKSPKTDIARMSVAQAAKEWYPRKHIYEQVLQVEDPDGLEEEWYAELAEKIDPNILKHRIVMGLIKRAKDGDEDAAMEAKIMATGMGLSIAQIKAGITPEVPKPEPSPEPPVPLLGPSGAMPSSAKQASDLSRTPEEAE